MGECIEMKILLKRIPFIITIALLTIFLSSCSSIIPDPAIKYAYIDLPFQSGLTYNGCGVASLAMVLEYYNMSISQEEIAEEIMVDDNPFTNEGYGNPFKMICYVKKLGLKAKFKLMSINKIKGYLQEGIPVIAIQFARFPKILQNLHYRVAIGYDDDSYELIFHDIIFGEDYKMEYSYFKSLNILGNIDICSCIIIYE
jgi:uncharacterized protein YvpB